MYEDVILVNFIPNLCGGQGIEGKAGEGGRWCGSWRAGSLQSVRESLNLALNSRSGRCTEKGELCSWGCFCGSTAEAVFERLPLYFEEAVARSDDFSVGLEVECGRMCKQGFLIGSCIAGRRGYCKRLSNISDSRHAPRLGQRFCFETCTHIHGVKSLFQLAYSNAD